LKTILMGILVLALSLMAASVTCPVDDSSSYFTGETKIDSGHLMNKYKCNLNAKHVFWVRADRS
jgi:hypothetical protein